VTIPKLYLPSKVPLPEGRAGTAWDPAEFKKTAVQPLLNLVPLSPPPPTSDYSGPGGMREGRVFQGAPSGVTWSSRDKNSQHCASRPHRCVSPLSGTRSHPSCLQLRKNSDEKCGKRTLLSSIDYFRENPYQETSVCSCPQLPLLDMRVAATP
jgi:hypothetical protein